MGKTKKTKLPKQIAGVKIPKKLRKKGGKLLAALDTPVGRDLAAAGLMAAIAAFARRKHAAAEPTATPEPESDKVQDERSDRDPHAAGAQFASAAAGVAAVALDRWLKHKQCQPSSPPAAATDPAPPGTTAH
ncbi:hypothetical protein ACFO8O_01550 [Hephaestia sp. GCM10023244]|uniref:hypothetical protein n=1 Tax=unclassified Hephaestia TaxID=2631281 RepID=UPI00207790E5|nr:hypothetical protein [Hephaestia sp. MAHUQ-44]MCM8729656.1 hypothetical protein [Hephaestia sp. MAHUQ-44]